MFKSQYNTNPIIFSPDGQLLQLNFAKKASDRGNIYLSLKSKNHIVLLGSLKSENRLFAFGDNVLLITTGISKDGKFLVEILKKRKYQNENSSNRFCQLPDIASFCSKIIARNTYYSHIRPFGIKTLILGYDSNGPVMFDINVDGNFRRTAFLAQGKSSNKISGHFAEISNEIDNLSIDELITRILLLYLETLMEKERGSLSENSICLSFLGKNSEMIILKEKIINFYLKIHKKKSFEEKANSKEKMEFDTLHDTDSSFEWSTYEAESDPSVHCLTCHSAYN